VIVDDDDFLEPDKEDPITEIPPATKPDPGPVVTPTQPPVIKPPVVSVPPTTGNQDPFDDPFGNGGVNPPSTSDPDPLPPPVVITRPPVVENPKPPVITDPGPSRPTTPTDPEPTPSATYHTVVKGDTLWNISQRYGLTVDQLKQLNGLNSNNISVGQQLKVN
jgi:nucleoid-associated protein YgaU